VKVDHYFTAAAGTLPPTARNALVRIPNPERRRLAVAQYHRRRQELDTLWTWSAEVARSHQQTTEYRGAMTDLRRLRRVFAALNPGYILVTDTNARLLGTQLRYWNREPSVLAAARELQETAVRWLASELFPVTPDARALERFLLRLDSYCPSRIPTVAVPGLSLHGQLRAFDFAILRRGRLVAGTSSASVDSVWTRGGWSRRLRRAVLESGAAFAGPLEVPNEPWHYQHVSEIP